MKPGLIDLHVHTTASDGTLSARDTVAAALARGLRLLAITDHDTTEGVSEAVEAAQGTELTLVPGVELSADTETEDIHVLGYFVNPLAPEIQQALAGLRETRQARNERILARLRALGAPVAPARVQEIARRGSVGRPHIAAALVEAGHARSQGEAFGRYLARGRPAYVPRAQLTVAQACDIIRRAGGLAVLAHPAKIGSRAAREQALAGGVDGIEVYHCDHSAQHVQDLLDLARARGLLVTGGSDSHGPYSDRPLALGEGAVPQWVGEALLARAPAWWRARTD